ncbi:hypothetical protein ONZ45_g11171 [Pleurotus djamor]|nr:hypothetical protein ONZ45_g11171 [Pleurotus djamor]
MPEHGHDIKRFILLNTRYAVLSHTWGASELNYQRIQSGSQDISDDPKFVGFSTAAVDFGCKYIWIDTACIDKSSSSELDESIRSMFTWYRQAYLCIVYLESYEPYMGMHFINDRWFRRGWTLQELLAPKRMVFLGKHWERIFPHDGHTFDIVRKFNLEGHRLWDAGIEVESYDNEKYHVAGLWWLTSAAGVSSQDMAAYEPSPSSASRMFKYMSNRQTTVPEDAAYCVLGLLGIILTAAYGEGRERAFYRLQVACAEQANERNIFIWDGELGQPSRFSSMLPRDPVDSSHFKVRSGRSAVHQEAMEVDATELWTAHLYGDIANHVDLSFGFTNAGLRIAVTLHDLESTPSLSVLRNWLCVSMSKKISGEKLAILGTYFDLGEKKVAAVVLERVGPAFTRRYRRVAFNVDQNDLPPLDVLLSRVPEIVYIV